MPHRIPPAADLHVHSIASGHAYSTINEIAIEAARKGLAAIGMTDHGPAMPGAPHAYHFMAMRFIPKQINGIRILRGVEANIQDGGKLDLPQSQLRKLDLVLAGFHEHCGYSGTTRQNHTETLLQVMHNSQVNVISHPGNPRYPVDAEAVVRCAVETNTALEFNNSSFATSRRGSKPNCQDLARLCAEHKAPVVVSSDAHIAQGVGAFRNALRVLFEAGVSPNQIVNRTLASTLNFLKLED